MMQNTESQVRALLNLIQDDDLKVASLAMEQFLKLEKGLTDRLLAEHQEAADPRLRHRIHQLSGILQRRRSRLEFAHSMNSQKMGIWEGLCRINSVYDLRCNQENLESETEKLITEMMISQPTALPQVAAVMREHRFSVPEETMVDIELYLVESVLESRIGSAAVLCGLTHHLASQAGWRGTVVLHEGRFCLIDRQDNLLDPSADWGISKLETRGLIHPCAPRDLWLAVLTQLFLVALVDGHLRDLYHFGYLLTALDDSDMTILPSPLGAGISQP